MNSKIFKYLKLKSELSADDLKQAESLAAMTEGDKQALVEFLGGKAKVTKPVKTRNVEKCADCDYTKRHQIHKVTAMVGFHEFRSALTKSGSRRRGMPSSPQPARCVACYEIATHSNHDLDNGGHEFTTDLVKRLDQQLGKHRYCTCGKPDDDNVHHLTTADGYHEFVSGEQAVGVGG